MGASPALPASGSEQARLANQPSQEAANEAAGLDDEDRAARAVPTLLSGYLSRRAHELQAAAAETAAEATAAAVRHELCVVETARRDLGTLENTSRRTTVLVDDEPQALRRLLALY